MKVKTVTYEVRVPADVWNMHVDGDTLTNFVERLGWEGLDYAMKSKDEPKKFKDVRITITPTPLDDPEYREVVIEVDYETVYTDYEPTV